MQSHEAFGLIIIDEACSEKAGHHHHRVRSANRRRRGEEVDITVFSTVRSSQLITNILVGNPTLTCSKRLPLLDSRLLRCIILLACWFPACSCHPSFFSSVVVACR